MKRIYIILFSMFLAFNIQSNIPIISPEIKANKGDKNMIFANNG